MCIRDRIGSGEPGEVSPPVGRRAALRGEKASEARGWTTGAAEREARADDAAPSRGAAAAPDTSARRMAHAPHVLGGAMSRGARGTRLKRGGAEKRRKRFFRASRHARALERVSRPRNEIGSSRARRARRVFFTYFVDLTSRASRAFAAARDEKTRVASLSSLASRRRMTRPRYAG